MTSVLPPCCYSNCHCCRSCVLITVEKWTRSTRLGIEDEEAGAFVLIYQIPDFRRDNNFLFVLLWVGNRDSVNYMNMYINMDARPHIHPRTPPSVNWTCSADGKGTLEWALHYFCRAAWNVNCELKGAECKRLRCARCGEYHWDWTSCPVRGMWCADGIPLQINVDATTTITLRFYSNWHYQWLQSCRAGRLPLRLPSGG